MLLDKQMVLLVFADMKAPKQSSIKAELATELCFLLGSSRKLELLISKDFGPFLEFGIYFVDD